MIEQGNEGLFAAAEAAATWYAIFEEEDAITEQQRRDFVEWLQRSPANIDEFMRVGSMQRQFSKLQQADLPDAQTLIDEALSNVVKISNQEIEGRESVIFVPTNSASHRKFFGAFFGAMVASTVLVIMSVLWSLSSGFNESKVISTRLGEQRSVALADGSVVNLNTESQVEIRYSDSIRMVSLAYGEAIFDVAKDADRPFRVRAGSALVEAIGTQFNIYRQSEQTIVTVVEGQISVSSDHDYEISSTDPITPSEKDTLLLAEGKQVRVSKVGVIAAAETISVRDATAWTNRRLVFNGDTLDTVVSELNRYNTRQLTISDRRVSRKTISGIFNANDPAALIAFLSEIGGLTVETDTTGNGWILYASRPATDE